METNLLSMIVGVKRFLKCSELDTLLCISHFQLPILVSSNSVQPSPLADANKVAELQPDPPIHSWPAGRRACARLVEKFRNKSTLHILTALSV